MDETFKVPREINQPPESIFIALGWDEFPPDQKRKHYRQFHPKELEKVKMIMPKESPFSSFDIVRGQSRGASKSWWPFGMEPRYDESGEISTETVVGKFKGIVTVQSEKAQKDYQDGKSKALKDLQRALNEVSKKILSKPFWLNISSLETSEGRVKLQKTLENLNLTKLNIPQHIAKL